MRAFVVVAFVLLVPLAAADTETGRTFGADLGNLSPGVWDVFQFDVPGGPTVLTLTWAAPPPLIPYSDYNLFLYGQGALDDGSLSNSERIAQSWNGEGYQPEQVDAPLAAGRYWVAVAPWQTQGETYTLTSSTGALTFTAKATGVQSCNSCG